MGAISFASLANVFRIPEIRAKLFFTAMILALYRLGTFITVPGIPAENLKGGLQSGGIVDFLNLWTGGGLSNAAIFGLGIMPFITASIIMQLMTVVIPSLTALQKEGEMGYIKINRITRYMTVGLAAMQSVGFFLVLHGTEGVFTDQFAVLSVEGMSRLALFSISLTAGAVLLMWFGELITQRGIGNGMSLLILASILSGVKAGLVAYQTLPVTQKLVLPMLIISITAAVVFIQEGQRRIPVQYAKRMVGRKMTQGGSTYLPLRVNMAGVIPIIFATALMAFPSTIAFYAPNNPVGQWIQENLSPTDPAGMLLEVLLVVMFTYFYTLVQFNPVDQADNLKKYGGFIPGVRPGQPTAQYLSRVLNRLTLPGSLYLAVLVIIPGIAFNMGIGQNLGGALGGTTILIVVGVALDSMRQMESQLVMRNYEGFLK